MSNETETTWNTLATGLFASRPSEVIGPLRVVNTLADIKALMRDKDAAQCIALTKMSGGSAVSTIIKRTQAIVSTIGGANSHIVVVARDYSVPCIVGAKDLDLDSLEDGTILRLGEDGTISVEAPDA